MITPPCPAPPLAHAPITTVVADGSPVVLSALRLLFEGKPLIELLGTAPDGREAVETVARHRPRLVLLSYHMPRMHGLLAARVIRCHFPATRIIVMSASRTPDHEALRRKFGADAFLAKANLAGALQTLIAEWFG